MSEFIGDEYEIEGGQEVVNFALEIEQAAYQYNPDYQSGVIDNFAIRKNSMDVIGETESRFMLTVDRLYICEGAILNAPLHEYTVSTETIRHGLDINAFPSDVWERLKSEFPSEDEDFGSEYSEEWLDELHDDETEFAVGYRYQHTLRSDGMLFPETGMVIYVNNTEINLADYRQSEVWGDGSEDYDEPETSSMPTEFEALFSDEDKNFFQEVGKAMLTEFRPTKFIDDLYDWMNDLRFRSMSMRVESMRSIVQNELPGFMEKVK